jgi:pimeloyl-ACP methyl ester carboxylesterase
MPRIDVDGIGIAYEIIGSGAKKAAITAGGRFSKDSPGQRELAEKLAEHGYSTLIWDRPNCGESDVHFEGESESILNADTLAGLLKALNFGPALLIGGSAGSRVTLLSAIRHPEVASGLFLLWISGGALGLATLAVVYCRDNAFIAETQGMEAVSALPCWEEQIRRNPGNRDRLLAQDPATFRAKMEHWAESFFPKTSAPVPGLSPDELAALKMPVTVLRSGKSDIYHPRETSEALAAMIPGSQLAEPPWGDSEWNEAMARPDGSVFRSWPKLAPLILEFAKTLPQ